MGNYLLQNMVNDHVQKMLTVGLRERLQELQRGPSNHVTVLWPEEPALNANAVVMVTQ